MRKCGECRMCCKHVYAAERGTIEGEPYEFIHYPGTWCIHVLLNHSEKGCKLHDTPRKPIACRTFACLWLLGFGDEEDRPDKIYVIGSVEPRAPLGQEPETYLIAYNCAPEAWKSQRAARFMQQLELLYNLQSAQGFEIVPFDPEEKVRYGLHKVHGHLEIHVAGFPPPLDADVERAEIASLFGGEMPKDLSTALLQEKIDGLPDKVRERYFEKFRNRMHRGEAQ